MTLTFNARDASRSPRELLLRVTATEAWERFPDEQLWSVLEAGGHRSLERSLKIERELLHPLRFNYYYRQPPKHVLGRWLALHDAVGEQFPLPRFDPRARLEEIDLLVAGLDFRAEPRTSRFKLWLQTKTTSELLRKALSGTKNGDASSFEEPDSTLLWGYDLGLDGTRTFKMYPRISSEKKTGSEDLVTSALPSHLHPLIGECRRVYLCIRDGKDESSFHFLPSSVPDFLRRLDFEPLERLIRDLGLEERIAIVSISSCPDGDWDTYALYYTDR